MLLIGDINFARETADICGQWIRMEINQNDEVLGENEIQALLWR